MLHYSRRDDRLTGGWAALYDYTRRYPRKTDRRTTRRCRHNRRAENAANGGNTRRRGADSAEGYLTRRRYPPAAAQRYPVASGDTTAQRNPAPVAEADARRRRESVGGLDCGGGRGDGLNGGEEGQPRANQGSHPPS